MKKILIILYVFFCSTSFVFANNSTDLAEGASNCPATILAESAAPAGWEYSGADNYNVPLSGCYMNTIETLLCTYGPSDGYQVSIMKKVQKGISCKMVGRGCNCQ